VSNFNHGANVGMVGLTLNPQRTACEPHPWDCNNESVTRTVAAQDRQLNIKLLKSAEQPQAVLLDMIAPSVGLLVKAPRTE
jgi:hypothetical protein